MDIPHKIEHKVSHQEWDEITFDAETLCANREKFLDDDDFAIGCPTFEFENGTVFVDESWGFKEGRIYTSSFMGGVTDWSSKSQSYIKCYYGRELDLGQLVSVSFTLRDELRASLGINHEQPQ